MNQEDKVVLLRQLHELRDKAMENGKAQAKHGRLAQANYWKGYIAAVDQMVSTILNLKSLPADML